MNFKTKFNLGDIVVLNKAAALKKSQECIDNHLKKYPDGISWVDWTKQVEEKQIERMSKELFMVVRMNVILREPGLVEVEDVLVKYDPVKDANKTREKLYNSKSKLTIKSRQIDFPEYFDIWNESLYRIKKLK